MTATGRSFADRRPRGAGRRGVRLRVPAGVRPVRGRRFTAGWAPCPAPFNRFTHATAGRPATRSCVNNDTVYSIAQLDLGGGPLLSRCPTPRAATTCSSSSTPGPTTSPTSAAAPPAPRRARTCSRRPAGTDAPPTASAIPVPTRSRSSWAAGPATATRPAGGARAPGGLRYATERRPRPAAQPDPAPPTSWPSSSSCGSGCRLPARASATRVPAALRAARAARARVALRRPRPRAGRGAWCGLAAGQERLDTHGGSTQLNGWTRPHLFDYNVDFFEVGTLDDARWTIADRPGPPRAGVAARGGLWGNHGYEAVYAQVFEDSGGRPLNGAHRYRSVRRGRRRSRGSGR